MQNLNTRHRERQGVEIRVRGTVQGVGFRPFIYNLATSFNISGTVTNTDDGVVIVAVCKSDNIDSFLRAIQDLAPPLARISSLDSRPLAATACEGVFTILPSVVSNAGYTWIPPDIALCSDCLRELRSPTNRRFNYPFINCTNCGPRLTIIETIPYDRPKTSMKVFEMCEPCNYEYHNPKDRRFHAQPNACPNCGPNISLHDNKGVQLPMDSPLAQTALALKKGLILAIKGMGGFHLSTNAHLEKAVADLRNKKCRPDKPLAIMVADIPAVKRICHLSTEEATLLCAKQHPIVLLKKRDRTSLAKNLAPGIEEIGVMLPYTPLQHLIFAQEDCPEALVMTSGNTTGTPICITNKDAVAKLGTIVDMFLFYNREIVTRIDDSVVKIIANQPIIFRRARGYVPAPIPVQWSLPNILACGAGLKNTFTLGRGHDMLPSQHIGDLDNLESYTFFQQSIDHLQRVFQLEPEVVACDLHPDYMSSQYAAKLNLPLYKVQHHHAHAVAVMAEHQIEGPVLAIILDGTGLGDDGEIWGGEILQAELTTYQRLGHLGNLRLVGGDVAAAEPWRMGLAALWQTFGNKALSRKYLPRALQAQDDETLHLIASMLKTGFNSPFTSSCGRLFDAVASIIGLRQYVHYEGQAAMELEALAKRGQTTSWVEDILPYLQQSSWAPEEKDGKWKINSATFVKMVIDGINRGDAPSLIALQFHGMLVGSISQLIATLVQQTGIRQVVLAGGCMQNSLLLEGFFHILRGMKLEVVTGNSLPINDGAISCGQAVIGGLRHVSRNTNEGDKYSG